MSAAHRLPPPHPRLMRSAGELFACGYDTIDIARELGIDEASALKLVSLDRDARLKHRTEFARPA